jgi:hypothetical protein
MSSRFWLWAGWSVLWGAVLGACSTAPQSYIDNDRVVQRTVIDRSRVVAVAVDGDYRTDQKRLPVTPGSHLVTFSAAPAMNFPVVQKTYPVSIAPCTEYYFAADRANRLSQDWTLVLEETRPVAGCNPANELEKAKAHAKANSYLESAPLASR